MEFKRNFKISIDCPICGKETSVFVEKEDCMKWIKGMSHNEVFSYLSTSELIFINDGICPICKKLGRKKIKNDDK